MCRRQQEVDSMVLSASRLGMMYEETEEEYRERLHSASWIAEQEYCELYRLYSRAAPPDETWR